MNAASNPHFQDLLLRYSQETDSSRQHDLERQIWQEYGREHAVLVLDMAGFSSTTDRYGIIHYLAMVKRMQLTADPIIRSFGGAVIKFEADNCFAVFPDVTRAARAAVAMNLAFDAANRLTPDALDIRIACGIDFGPILVVDGSDFFGDAVNRASKLGEDLAKAGEVLLTRSATALLEPGGDWHTVPVDFSISGLRLEAAQLRFYNDPEASGT